MATRLVSPVLVGRNDEMARFLAAYGQASRGNPTVVVVAGEAGVGKSRFLAESTERARRDGAHILAGGCVELGGEGVPFVPIVEALRGLVHTTPPGDLDDILGPGRRDLARLLPELDPDAAREVGDPGATGRLFELVLGVLSRLAARQPLVVTIEDVHWADRSTLDLLAFLIRALRTDRVLVVMTYRAEDVRRLHPLRRLLAELERLPNAERVELTPFGRTEVTEQLAAILGDDPPAALVDTVFERSQGNAFFVEELAATGGHPGNLRPGLRDVLLSRVEALAPATQPLLQAVSAAGQRVGHRLLARVAAVPGDDLDAALQDAVDHQVLVVEDRAGYAFRHALVREAVYDDILPGQRTKLHLAYAEALESDPTLAEGGATPAAMLAYHWSSAHDPVRALTASVAAGRQAAAAYGYAEAAQHLEHALELWPLVPDAEAHAGIDLIDLYDRAATAWSGHGTFDRAVALLDEAIRLVDREQHPVRAAVLLSKRGRLRRDAAQDDAYDDLNEAAALLPVDAPERASVLAATAAAGLVLSNFDFGLVREVATEAIEAARAVGDMRALADALATLGPALAYDGDRDTGVAKLREAVSLADSYDDDRVALRAIVNLSDVLWLTGNVQESADVARRGLSLAQRVGLFRIEGIVVASNLIEALLVLGEWDEARAVLADALSVVSPGVPQQWLRLTDAQVAVAMGDVKRAAHELSYGTDFLDNQMRIAKKGLHAEVAVLEGRLLDARAILVDVLNGPVEDRYAWPSIWLAMRVEADIAMHARARRVAVDDEHLDRVQAIAKIAADLPRDVPTLRAYVAVIDAEQARAAGAAAGPEWERAVEAWREAGDVFRTAYAQYRLAEARVSSGDKSGAVDPLLSAITTARRLGAAPLAGDIESLAARARIDLAGRPAADSGGDHGLTPREVDVLLLVAEGRTNAEIAGSLFISAKTASVHVSNILRKLDVANRGEAAAAARRLGLLGD